MSFVGLAIGIGSAVSAGAAIYSGRQTAKAGERAAGASNAESARQFDLVRGDTAHTRELGQGATSILGRLYGIPVQTTAQRTASAPMLVGDTELPPGTTTKHVGNGWYEVWNGGRRIGTLRPGGSNGQFINDTGFDVQAALAESQRQASAGAGGGTGTPDMSAFFESPDFQFNLERSEKALSRAQASTGRFNSGRAGLELVRNASGHASQEFGNFTNRLLQMAGLGSAAVNTSANAGFQHAGNVGANNSMAANARASGFQTAASGVNNAVQGGISSMLLHRFLTQGA